MGEPESCPATAFLTNNNLIYYLIWDNSSYLHDLYTRGFIVLETAGDSTRMNEASLELGGRV